MSFNRTYLPTNISVDIDFEGRKYILKSAFKEFFSFRTIERLLHFFLRPEILNYSSFLIFSKPLSKQYSKLFGVSTSIVWCLHVLKSELFHEHTFCHALDKKLVHFRVDHFGQSAAPVDTHFRKLVWFEPTNIHEQINRFLIFSGEIRWWFRHQISRCVW